MEFRERGTAAAALISAASVLAFFAAILGGACLAGADMSACFEPLAQALSDGVRRGDLLRTQRLFNGLPLLAHVVSATAYPPQLLVAVMEPARALALLSLLHLTVAGAGTAALLRTAGRSAGAAVAGGIALALSGMAASSMVQPNLVRALAWLPWLLLLVGVAARARAGRRMLAIAALALVTAMQLLTAEPFVLLPAGLAAAILVAGHLRTGRAGLAPALRASAGLLAGVLIALPLLLPALMYAGHAVRAAGFISEGANQWSLHPAQFLEMIVPRAFGDPSRAGLEGFVAVTLVPGRSSAYFLSSYLGAAALGLAAAGIACGGRRERACAIIIAALAVLALGTHGPARPLLDALGVDWLRYPVKWLFPALLPFSLLVATGADALDSERGDESDGTRPARVGLGILLACAALPAAAAALAAPLAARIAWLAPTETPAAIRELLRDHAHARLLAGASWSAAAAIGLVLATIVLRRAGHASRAAWLAAMVLALDLGPQARRCVTLTDADFYRELPPVTRALLAEPARQRTWLDAPSTQRSTVIGPPTMLEVTSWQRELMMFYSAASAGIDVAFPADIEALSPLRIHQLADVLARAGWRERLMLLGAAGVTHVVTMDASTPAHLTPLAAELPARAGTLRVLRNRLALPRARVVPRVLLHGGSSEFEHVLATSREDLFASATLVSRSDWDDFHPGAAPPAGTIHGDDRAAASISAESAGRLDVRVTGSGGCLVVSDAWLPGLSAQVDGEDAPIFPADHAFVGVLVPPGAHEVAIRYSPWRR